MLIENIIYLGIGQERKGIFVERRSSKKTIGFKESESVSFSINIVMLVTEKGLDVNNYRNFNDYMCFFNFF